MKEKNIKKFDQLSKTFKMGHPKGQVSKHSLHTSLMSCIYLLNVINNVINVKEETGKMLQGTTDGFQLLTMFEAKC